MSSTESKEQEEGSVISEESLSPNFDNDSLSLVSNFSRLGFSEEVEDTHEEDPITSSTPDNDEVIMGKSKAVVKQKSPYVQNCNRSHCHIFSSYF